MELGDIHVRKWARKTLKTQANSNYVLCEVLRLINDELYIYKYDSHRKKIFEYLIDCMIMAKSMSDRLVYYKKTYKDTTGKRGKNLPSFGSKEVRLIMRKVREGYI